MKYRDEKRKCEMKGPVSISSQICREKSMVVGAERSKNQSYLEWPSTHFGLECLKSHEILKIGHFL